MKDLTARQGNDPAVRRDALGRLARAKVSPEVRFWRKVTGDSAESCWTWNGHQIRGYGRFRPESRGRAYLAHRYAYEFLRAEIPQGLELDHLCRNPICVNPWHLEPVTHRVNVLRSTSPTAGNAAKTACDRGHEFSPENTYRTARGTRRCRACHAEGERDRRLRAGSFEPRTHCRGEGRHELAVVGTYVDPKGRKMCRACQREADRRYKQRMKKAKSEAAS